MADELLKATILVADHNPDTVEPAPGQILIGESTFALVEDVVVARKFGGVELRA